MDYSDKKVEIAAEVVQSFMTISKVLVKYTQQNATSLGLTLQQMGILNTIYSSPGITLKEITEKLQLSKSTVSVNVDDLVNAKLVERKTSAEDRREINLNLTAEGEELARKSCRNASSYKAMMSALATIPEEKIHWLLETHGQLLKNLQESEF
ncbi:MarR family transcriptional regulator [Desulfosporosinus sp. PR]|uniref:MarR family winged helix-turn-helix transcriptional regulator n=1 Tax=Candidatus Desulfosporosinus nitrosoreducens TaxID=3401928 RepID=UPI0027EF6DF7|nr:MarR family transcriptional regulator [Desulfosporosinus sp. PR]MDQ7094840.1 MarR family transcriptional regulator [Desulfosporosinus sp. PR]